MLAKNHKLKDSEAIKLVLKTGRRARGRYLTAFWLETEAPLQAAVVISKKAAGSAVQRNRVRRIIFNALEQLPLWTDQHSGGIVVLVNTVPDDNNLLVTELNQCLNKLSLI